MTESTKLGKPYFEALIDNRCSGNQSHGLSTDKGRDLARALAYVKGLVDDPDYKSLADIYFPDGQTGEEVARHRAQSVYLASMAEEKRSPNRIFSLLKEAACEAELGADYKTASDLFRKLFESNGSPYYQLRHQFFSDFSRLMNC